MVEKIQRMDKPDDVVEEYQILPSSIQFERLVNLGNYENVRFGGDFKIPEGMAPEKALQEVSAFLAKQIDVYLQENPDRSHTKQKLERTKEQFEEFRKKLLAAEEDPALKIRRLKAGLKGEILEIGGILKDIKIYTQNLSAYANNLFYVIEDLLKANNLTLQDLGLESHYSLPKKFQVQWKEIEPEPENEDDEDYEDDEDEDDYEDEEEDEDY